MKTVALVIKWVGLALMLHSVGIFGVGLLHHEQMRRLYREQDAEKAPFKHAEQQARAELAQIKRRQVSGELSNESAELLTRSKNDVIYVNLVAQNAISDAGRPAIDRQVRLRDAYQTPGMIGFGVSILVYPAAGIVCLFVRRGFGPRWLQTPVVRTLRLLSYGLLLFAVLAGVALVVLGQVLSAQSRV